jgi:competence protein ComEC
MKVRLPVLAVVAVVGVWVSGRCEVAAAVWAAAAVIAAIGVPRPWRAIVVVGMLAAALGARARAPMGMVEGVVSDDRGEDVVEGWVSGPITETRAGVSYVIEAGGASVLVRAEGHGGVLPGDRVRVVGRVVETRGYRNPGAADRVLAAQARGARWEIRAKRVERIAGERVSGWRWPAAIARWASGRVEERGGDRIGNALVRAAVLGDRSGLDEETDAAWRAAGVFHALSVSGLHLAAVTLVVFVIVGWAWAFAGLGARVAPRRAAAVVALPAALAYTLVTGAQVATLRALLVVGVVLVGEIIRQRARAADALGLAALVVLALDPLALHDPGFQLSFVAAATLIVAAASRQRMDPIFVGPRSWPRRVVDGIGRALATSTAVALATAPITAWHFHEIAFGGVIGNLIVTPLVELVTIPIGLAGILVGGPVIDLAVAIAGFTADIVAVIGAHTPSLVVPPPSGVELLACGGLYAAWALHATGHLRAPRTALLIAVIAAVALAGSWAYRAHQRADDDRLRVTFLDVGQGDAAVIELPGGEVWLVDAGGVPGGPTELRAAARPGEEVARFLRARRIDRIDVAVISHPHPDHYLGLLALAPRVDIGELWIAAEPPDPDAGFARVAAWLAGRGVRIVHPALGAHRRGDVTMRVLAPVYDPGDGALPHAAADPVRTVNDNSLVLAVERAGRRIVFLGDLEEEGEAVLAAAAGDLRSDVVKVAHHGSATSSSQVLVDATRPQWAVMSLGRGNRFGFPAPAVVARWTAAGAAVLRTDEAGAITLTVDRAGTLQIARQDPP